MHMYTCDANAFALAWGLCAVCDAACVLRCLLAIQCPDTTQLLLSSHSVRVRVRRYHDPLHTFHDWQAEERLREVWLSLGIIEDGAKAAAAAARADSGKGDASVLQQRWIDAKSQWRLDLKALQRAREERRKQGIKAVEGTYVESTHARSTAR